MSNNEVFCPAPFVHFYHKGSKTGKICCMAKPAVFHSNKASDTWTQKKYKQVRQDMLNGVSVQECKACYDTEKQGGHSDRQYYLQKYNDLNLTYDVSDGNTEYKKPVDLDLRLSNLCNLGCRMCGPHYSSILEKASEELKELDGFANPTTSNSMLTDNDIDWLITDNPDIKRIKFLGGEPTVMNEVYKILDILVEKQRQPQIGITTNCTNVNKRFIDYMNYFKKTTVNMSIDGTDKTLEYIRHPVKYEIVKKNIVELSKLNIRDLNANYCIQALNVNNLKSSIDFFASLEKLDSVNSVIVDYPIGTSIYYLPVDYRKPYLEEALDSKHIDHPAFKKVFKAQLESIYKSDKELDMQKFLHRNMKFDQLRNQHLYNILPDLRSYIEKAIHNIGNSSTIKSQLTEHYIDKE